MLRFWPALTLFILAAAMLLAGTGQATAQDDAAAPPLAIDYDIDDDGLIEIRTLEQLNAIRWDLLGQVNIHGRGSTNQRLLEDRRKHRAAFPNAIEEYFDFGTFSYISTPMGCGRDIHPSLSGFCIGYELAADLDFDTNGDGVITAADGDLSWNDGKGWVPIGVEGTYSGIFQGNGHTISNMMINSDGIRYVGLFGRKTVRPITGVGLHDVDIRAVYYRNNQEPFYVGGLVGQLSGHSTGDAAVRSSYVTGKIAVTPTGYTSADAGGLVGAATNGARIAGSWADVDVTATTAPASDGNLVGGLVGEVGPQAGRRNFITASYALGEVSTDKRDSYIGGLVGIAYNATITASYAAGQPRFTGTDLGGGQVGGLVGLADETSTLTDSYWDRSASGIAGAGSRTTAELRRPTNYAGIYEDWDNVDVDNADGDKDITTGVDAPWDFGTASQYPALKGPVAARAGGDVIAYLGAEVTLNAGLAQHIRNRLTPVSAAGATYQWHQSREYGAMPDTYPTRVHSTRYTDAEHILTLSDASAPNPTFTAPAELTAPVTLGFGVTITTSDGVVFADWVRVTVNLARPNELTSLTVNAGDNQRPLTPRFVSNVRPYDTYVGAYTTTAEIVMEPAEDNATISFNGDDPQTGIRTKTVGLAEGHNRFTITVTPPEPDPAAEGETEAEPLEPATYHLNIRRQPVPRLAFDPPNYLLVDEGDTATYTVELDTRWIGAEITVAITSDNPDITVSPEQVSFRPTDWDPRTIRVTVAEDADWDDDFAILDHSASGGHFDNVYGRLRVEVSDDDTVAPTPTPTPDPTPTPTPGPTPLQVATTTSTATLSLSGRTVTITRETGALLEASVSLPSVLTRNLAITYAPLVAGIPMSSPRYRFGETPAGQSTLTLKVTGVPTGGLELCLPLSNALVTEAGSRPLTLTRYEGAGWNALPNAQRRGMSVCADAVASGLFAAAYIVPQLGPASGLTATPGADPGTLVLRWTPGNDATRHWIAGIKQSDLAAGDSSSLIWTASDSSAMHSLTGLESGAEYVFAVAAGLGAEWSAWTAFARGTPQ